ncbi:protein of unknown function [Salegentibacter echinorum]|uniref:DUF4251 domain-containing protein n=1 Tax=Salegentibacter echinorum TaxID=1073325 RepID=A0A1M5I1I4_SALEC|nr:DUF4251 domain-containing protein [Salegentibacter echinorum]SHG22151.1 protein of unknown function [Salegentibacter echinorum]
MKKIKSGIITIFIVLILIFLGCGSAQDSAEKIAERERTAELISSGEFEINNTWALPMSGGQVNLIGNTNYIRFKTDSVELFLPYFGVRYSGGGYNAEGGIAYKGSAKNFESYRDEDKDRQVIKFEAKKGTENFTFRINVFSNGKTSTNVNTTQRSNISYRGEIKALESKEKD